MKREHYDNQQHSSFQPQAVAQQSALGHHQLHQPKQHSSAIAPQQANWFDQANQWVSDKVQAAQSFVNGAGAIATDDILPALQSGSQSQATQSNQALVGVIDSGFGVNDHGTQMLNTIRDVNPEASVVLKDGVGKGNWAESLTEFVDTAKASGQTGAVANLSFDLTEVRPDGTVTTRSQLTAEEQSALAYARDNNVLVVASAGNEGGAMSALGQASQQFENVIAVGAAAGNGRADYSSFGPGLDLVANGSKNGKEGTSFAAAEVTGAISEIWEANPHLSARQVAQTLQATATDLHTPGWDAETGAGKLNLDRARSVAQQITPDTKSFSGADLLHQTQASFDGTTWQSKDGAIASERSNFRLRMPKLPKPREAVNAVRREARETGAAVNRTVRNTTNAVRREAREAGSAVRRTTRDAANTVRREAREAGSAVRRTTRDAANTVRREAREAGSAVRRTTRDAANTVRREAREAGSAVRRTTRDAANTVRREARETGAAVAQTSREVGKATQEAWRDTSDWTRRNYGTISEVGHTALDVAGMIPVVGAVADGVNAAWYLAEGDYANAALSGVGMIPGLGDAATATKLGMRGARLIRNGDRVVDVGRQVDNVLSRSGRAMEVAALPSEIAGTVQGSREAYNQFSQGNYLQGGLALTQAGVSAVGVGSGARSGVQLRGGRGGQTSGGNDRGSGTPQRSGTSSGDRIAATGIPQHPGSSGGDRAFPSGQSNRPENLAPRQPEFEAPSRNPQPTANGENSPPTSPRRSGASLNRLVHSEGSTHQAGTGFVGRGGPQGIIRHEQSRDLAHASVGGGDRIAAAGTPPRPTSAGGDREVAGAGFPGKPPQKTEELVTVGARPESTQVVNQAGSSSGGFSGQSNGSSYTTSIPTSPSGGSDRASHEFEPTTPTPATLSGGSGRGGSEPPRTPTGGSPPSPDFDPNRSNTNEPLGLSDSSNELTPAEIAEFRNTHGTDIPPERLRDPQARQAVREYLARSRDPQRATEDIFTNEQTRIPSKEEPSSKEGTSVMIPKPTEEIRREPGVAEGGEDLPDTDQVLQFTLTSGRTVMGRIPGQIARVMRGVQFKNFEHFRETFWKHVAEHPKLSQGWTEVNLDRMREGKAPFAQGTEQTGGKSNAVLQLDHSDDLQYGGGLYDMSRIRIVTPRFHDEYGGKKK